MDKYFQVLDQVAMREGAIDSARLKKRMQNELVRLFDCKPEAAYIIRVWKEQRGNKND